ncbi:MAG: EF-P beta-lysylation protein EpmB [Gammaproteobacteria bacterium]|nr:EF-P beta-lysylation protein EpmB [Gammaproteobacteria bacterium]
MLTSKKTICTDINELLELLSLNKAQVNYSDKIHQDFSLRVPYSFIAKMEKGNPYDPLLLQILPRIAELEQASRYEFDPLKERDYIDDNGLIQKYQARLLLMPTSACGIHCRYCFRRHFPYHEQAINKQNIENQIIQIQKKSDIKEVILSGGDPLLLSNKNLGKILTRLNKLSQLQYLRIHTRQLIVEPKRIDDELISIFKSLTKPLTIVFHCNHANELDSEVQQKLQQLKFNNIQLLNQSVLLKGINDSVESLSDLSERLLQYGVLPYYLHQLDKVIGTGHFEVSDQHAIMLIQQLKTRLPGYLVPKLVRETPGAAYKESVF